MKFDPTVVLLATPNIPHHDVVTNPQSNPVLGRIFTSLVTPKCVVPITEHQRSSLKKDSNCKHGLLNICCAICKEQLAGGLVDARGTAKAYTQTRKSKKDPIPSNLLFPSVTDSEKLSQILQTLFHPGPRFQQVTPEDVDWAERQPRLNKRSVKAKSLDQFWCETCFAYREDVVTADGVVIVHECKPAPIIGRSSKDYLKIATANHAALQIKHTERVTHFNLGYPIDSCVRCETPLRKVIGNPKPGEEFDPKKQEQLERVLGKGAKGVSFSEVENSLNSPQERKMVGPGGGHRVNTVGLPEDDQIDYSRRELRGKSRYDANYKGDRSSRDHRGNAVLKSKRVERYVGKTLTKCLRPSCGKVFAARTGTKYCSKNCCNRHNEELKLIEENTCQQALLLEHRVVLN